MADEVVTEFAWRDEPSLDFVSDGDAMRVTFDPRLSEAQVAAACAALGDDGILVLQAWRRSVGITDRPPAT